MTAQSPVVRFESVNAKGLPQVAAELAAIAAAHATLGRKDDTLTVLRRAVEIAETIGVDEAVRTHTEITTRRKTLECAYCYGTGILYAGFGAPGVPCSVCDTSGWKPRTTKAADRVTR